MVDFDESDKIIKISGKVDKSNTYNGFSNNILFFIHGRTLLYLQIQVFGLSTFPLFLSYIYIYIYIYIYHCACASMQVC